MPSKPESVPALIVLRNQFDAKFPGRSRISDGWIGDAAHRARKSFHNPDGNNWVHARDFTHDPRNGMDISRITDELTHDNRVLELIANDLYWHHSNPRWVNYSGSNEHRQHFHITAKPGGAAADTRPWNLPLLGGVTVPIPPPSSGDDMRLGSKGENVKQLQSHLKSNYRSYAGKLVVDGDFGQRTHNCVCEFQRRSHLTADGVVGIATRAALHI